MIEDGYEVKVLKLVTGEEILAFTKIDQLRVRIKHPYSLVVTKEGQIAVIPFMLYAEIEEGVDIGKNHIIMIVDAKPDLVANYKASMSNILTPNKQLLL